MQRQDPSIDQAVLIGIGANLPSADFGSPLQTCRTALRALEMSEIVVRMQSPWYESAPVPPSDQPWYVNGVVVVDTDLGPGPLLKNLLRIEEKFGRVRAERNAARVLDLDLLAHGRLVVTPPGWPELPHPRLADRAFVLLPLRDVAGGWRHPIDGRSVDELIADLPAGQDIRRHDPEAE